MQSKYGELDIYSPLEMIYAMNTDCDQTDIFLLTSGVVLNTDQIIQLVASNSNEKRRLHTLGFGKDVDETLIKKCAANGFGNFNFIEGMSEIEYKVIDSLKNIGVNYKVLQNITFFDKDGN